MEYQLPPDERLRLPSAAWQIIRFGAIYTVCVLWRLGCWITCMNMPRGTGTYGKVMLQGRHSKSHSFHKSRFRSRLVCCCGAAGSPPLCREDSRHI